MGAPKAPMDQHVKAVGKHVQQAALWAHRRAEHAAIWHAEDLKIKWDDEAGSGQVSCISLEDEGRGFLENERGIPRAKITSQKVDSFVHKTKILVIFIDLVLYFVKISPFAFLCAWQTPERNEPNQPNHKHEHTHTQKHKRQQKQSTSKAKAKAQATAKAKQSKRKRKAK